MSHHCFKLLLMARLASHQLTWHQNLSTVQVLQLLHMYAWMTTDASWLLLQCYFTSACRFWFWCSIELADAHSDLVHTTSTILNAAMHLHCKYTWVLEMGLVYLKVLEMGLVCLKKQQQSMATRLKVAMHGAD